MLSSISGSTEINIKPLAAPIIAKPTMIMVGLFSRPMIGIVPINYMPTDMSTTPSKITYLLEIFLVRKCTRGQVTAYKIPGTAKLNPMNSGEKPYSAKWTDSVGAMN